MGTRDAVPRADVSVSTIEVLALVCQDIRRTNEDPGVEAVLKLLEKRLKWSAKVLLGQMMHGEECQSELGRKLSKERVAAVEGKRGPAPKPKLHRLSAEDRARREADFAAERKAEAERIAAGGDHGPIPYEQARALGRL